MTILIFLFLAKFLYSATSRVIINLFNKHTLSRGILWQSRKYFRFFTINRLPNVRIAAAYLADKLVDGFCLGIVFFLFGLLDHGAGFVKSVEELLLNIHPALVVLGTMAAFSYICLRWFFRSNWIFRRLLLRISRAWFDLVQQFFTIALGAFLPVKVLVIVKEAATKGGDQGGRVCTGTINCVYQQLTLSEAHFLTLALCAFLVGSMWALKDRPHRLDARALKRIKVWITAFFITAIYLLWISLTEYEAGMLGLRRLGKFMIQLFDALEHFVAL